MVTNIRVTSTLVVFIAAIHNASFCHCLIFDDNCILLHEIESEMRMMVMTMLMTEEEEKAAKDGDFV